MSQFIVLKRATQVDVGLPSHSILAINVFQKMYLNMVQCHESASGSQEETAKKTQCSNLGSDCSNGRQVVPVMK